MSIYGTYNKQLQALENYILSLNKDKWKKETVSIFVEGTGDNKTYNIDYDNKHLIYDSIDDFYNEYNIQPYKDINPIIFNIVDNSHLEKVLYSEEG